MWINPNWHWVCEAQTRWNFISFLNDKKKFNNKIKMWNECTSSISNFNYFIIWILDQEHFHRVYYVKFGSVWISSRNIHKHLLEIKYLVFIYGSTKISKIFQFERWMERFVVVKYYVYCILWTSIMSIRLNVLHS